MYKLIIPLFSFQKKHNSKIAGPKDVFVCNACEKEDVQIVVHAVLDNLGKNGKSELFLKQFYIEVPNRSLAMEKNYSW